MRLIAGVLLACVASSGQTISLRGTASDTGGAGVAGVRFEFLPAGSSEKKTAETGADGKYSLELPVGRYRILLSGPGLPRAESQAAYLGPAERKEIVLNARVPKDKPGGVLEYDVVGEWRVVDAQDHGIGPAKVTFEGLRPDGRRSTFPLYVVAGEEERQVDGPLDTDPAGRFVFRIRETHIVPDRVAGLVVTAEMPGYSPHSERIFPVLQFSETGHLFASYPEEGVRIALKPRQ
jgi:hypothetical protein